MKSGESMRINSLKGNDYLLSKSVSQLLYLHPIMARIIGLREQGIELQGWIANLNGNGYTFSDGFKISLEEAQYYQGFIALLEENKYFEEIEKNRMCVGRYDGDSIKRTLANTRQIVFEVCNSCNLNCRYCSYGELYVVPDADEINMPFETAKKVLDFMFALFESPLNRRLYKKNAVSFYGGEPLKRMPFVKEVVDYVNKRNLSNNDFFFSMTTNGVLLAKYMDYLYEHDFHLLISLDGNREHNRYREFKDGSESFEVVYENVLALKKKYPFYYEKSVTFNAVLHNKNSNSEVKEFFKRNLHKEPNLSEINNLGIKSEKKTEFDNLYKKASAGLSVEELKEAVKDRNKILRTPFVGQLQKFFEQFSGMVFRTYDALLNNVEIQHYVRTGTCDPFERAKSFHYRQWRNITL